MIDFHSHILPGVDDGSTDMEMSLKMLQEMKQQGLDGVVATPHFYANHDNPQKFLERRQKAESALRKAMKGKDLPRVYMGAEVRYFDGISDCEPVDRLTIADSKYLLVEMPNAQWCDRHYRELLGLQQKRGIIPVIAHLDRYITPWRNAAVLDALSELPVLVQVNSEFFTRRLTRAMAIRLLKQDCIHLIGSDCHNLSDRKPDLDAGIQIIRKRLGESALKQIASYESQILA